MLSVEEIKQLIDDHKASKRFQSAKKGLDYYEAKHDIEDYKVFYVNNNGEFVEDKYRSNIKISHPFFTEQIDQCAQYMLSGQDSYVKSDDQELQKELDSYFDDEFKMELTDLITYCKIEGDSYLYRFIDKDFKTRFKFADGMNVIEVNSKYTKDNKDYVIYYYFDRKEEDKDVYGIQVWSYETVSFFTMVDDKIEKDATQPLNPKPHIAYKEGNKIKGSSFGSVPFIRLDNNRKRVSDLFIIKDLIDDYDLMACGLSNNLQDVAEGIYVVKGWSGENLDDLVQSIKVKKQVAVGEDGDLNIKTIDVPYQARVIKMEVDEKNIYRFGMALNTAEMSNGNYTNNVNIKSRYALLDLKCNKLENNLKRMMKKVIEIVIDEINKKNKTAYKYSDCWVEFEREVMTNATDNAQIKQIEAQTEQIEVATLLSLAPKIGDDYFLERLCDVLDLDYEDVKSKIKQNAPIDLNQASEDLMNAEVTNEESA